uniref:(northern house mosquito) hypothetical protein n=1 Tax=Culex pipiens TaxID=7175 RepID=A0A8D8IEX8_CULPI
MLSDDDRDRVFFLSKPLRYVRVSRRDGLRTASALSSHSFLLIELILIYKHISSSVLVVVLLRIPLLCNKSSLYLALCTTTTASLVLVVPRSSPLHVHTPLRVLQKRSGIFVETHRVSLGLLRSETISLQASFI